MTPLRILIVRLTLQAAWRHRSRLVIGVIVLSAAPGWDLATTHSTARPGETDPVVATPAIDPGVCIDTSFYTGAQLWDVTISGTLACVARIQSGMAVYSLAQPGAPELLDTYASPGYTFDIAVRGNYAYLAVADFFGTDRGVLVVNMANPSNLQPAGQNLAPVNAVNLDVRDTLLFVADGTVPGKLWIMSLSNPTSPVVIGSYPTPHHVKGVQVIDTLVYLALAQDGMAIVNVANPTLPVTVGALGGILSAYDIAVEDTLACIANGSYGLTVVDVSDPTAPALLSNFDTPDFANDVEVQGSVAHVADIDGGYRIIDISNPLQPALIEAVPTAHRMLGLAVEGSRTYGADDSDLTVFVFQGQGFCGDASTGPCEECDDANDVRGDGCATCRKEPQVGICPVAGFETPGSAYGVMVRDSLLYVADGSSGLQIYNARYSGPPAHLGGYNTPGSARRVDVDGNLAAVADQTGGLVLLDVSNPIQPSFLGRYATSTQALDVELVDTLAYVSCTNYFHVVNIAHPAAPDSVASLFGTGAGNGVKVAGNRAYIASGISGMFILSISNPASPSVLGNFLTGTTTEDVEARGDTVYLASGQGGVVSLYVANPVFSNVFDVLPADYAYQVVRQGGYLYVADDDSGIMVYDVATPTSPVHVASVPLTYNIGFSGAFGLFVTTDRVYMAEVNAVTMAALSIRGEHWCGNGVLEPGEYCDDSNYVPTDGCDPCCQLEPPLAMCGNGKVEYPEECDDGNSTPGDGCDPVCLREPAACGNGILEYPEGCDDGNADSADGCTNQCVFGPVCGDGTVDPSEECDDGNRTPGDGCDDFCRYEHTCGDGVLELGEECDDGNLVALDGCSPDCIIEACLIVIPGDVNNNGNITSADIISMVGYIFKGGASPQPCRANGDVNCTGTVTSADIIVLINFVFKSGMAPCDICHYSPLAVDCTP